jgi:hypothetical protein
MFTRPLPKTFYDYEQVPHVMNQGRWNRGALALRAGTPPLSLPGEHALMPTGNGGYVRAALDPTDPRTWAGYGPVVFT